MNHGARAFFLGGRCETRRSLASRNKPRDLSRWPGVLTARTLFRPAIEASMFASSTASMSVVRDEHAGRGLFLWNLTGHDADLIDGPA